MNPLIFLMLDYPDKLSSFLKTQLSENHHDFIPIVLELAANKSIQLLPHYLADYLLKKIDKNEEINPESVRNIMFSIYYPNVSQRVYILNLLSLEILFLHLNQDLKILEQKNQFEVTQSL